MTVMAMGDNIYGGRVVFDGDDTIKYPRMETDKIVVNDVNIVTVHFVGFPKDRVQLHPDTAGTGILACDLIRDIHREDTEELLGQAVVFGRDGCAFCFNACMPTLYITKPGVYWGRFNSKEAIGMSGLKVIIESMPNNRFYKGDSGVVI